MRRQNGLSAIKGQNLSKNNEYRITIIAGVFSLVGALIGSGITIFFSGYVESEKISVTQKKNAIDAFIEFAWEDPNDKDQSNAQYFKKLQKLSIYAPDNLLRAVVNYHGAQCAENHDESYKCKALWAKVVQEIRELSGSDRVTDDAIISLIWGQAALKK